MNKPWFDLTESFLIHCSKQPQCLCHSLWRVGNHKKPSVFSPDSTLTDQPHNPAQVFCGSSVWSLCVPAHQVSRRRQQRSTLLFRTSPPWGLHIRGWTKMRTVERKKSGHCEVLPKHPCVSFRSKTYQKLVDISSVYLLIYIYDDPDVCLSGPKIQKGKSYILQLKITWKKRCS